MQDVKERLARDAFAKDAAHHKMMVATIMNEVGSVVQTHKARSAAWYNAVRSSP